MLLCLCLAAAAGLNAAALPYARFPFPELSGMRLSAEDAVQTSALVALGMRRLAADLDFIRLMMYYGEAEAGALEEENEAVGHEHGHYYSEPGRYSAMKPRAMRILNLDPYFPYAPLYAAGALAFNLGRPEEALEILREASRWDPHQWKYGAYIAGIGFSKKGNPRDVVRELSPVLSDPECPAMLKNILAYLDRRLGRRDEAIKIYEELLESKDPSYYEVARKALREMGIATPGN